MIKWINIFCKILRVFEWNRVDSILSWNNGGTLMTRCLYGDGEHVISGAGVN